ncbi:MAG TPA: hypothetical protein VK654_08770 [Nitrospirota bacterium]|nr:hypothetical protein [Nitrospirota bacterium]
MYPEFLEKRRYRRFTLDLVDLFVRMHQAEKVEILDLSFGGVCMKVDRRINIGRTYTMKLGYGWTSIEVKGIAVRSQVSGVAESFGEPRSLIYTAAMKFDEDDTYPIAEFIRNSVLE